MSAASEKAARRIVQAREVEQHAARLEYRQAWERQQAAKVLPFPVRSLLHSSFVRTREADGFNAAHRQFYDNVRTLVDRARESGRDSEIARVEGREQLNERSPDSQVKAWARKRAAECYALAGTNGGGALAFIRCRSYAQSFGVQAPPVTMCKGFSGALARLCASKWWRRKARVLLTRRIEGEKISQGKVSRRAGLYLSDVNFARGKEARARNRQLLLDMEAVNEAGQRFSLADLADKSVSRPHIRFSEMMVRIKGLEAIAERDGWRGLFLTVTCPSRFHSTLSASGDKNPNWQGAQPREAQNYLRDLWARARAKLQRLSLQFFGLRVAEPHHDGCPHWHLMLWVRPGRIRRAVRVLRGYALDDSPGEPGAAAHRFKVERIEKSKGGAASYLAKYVSKLTTGSGLGSASERGADGERREVGKATNAALRAQLWAWAHGIRQFQFFGSPAVGIWREFRRMREPLTAETFEGRAGPGQLDLFERARASADASDYAAHVDACGGVCLPRDLARFSLAHEPVDERNEYGEKKPDRITGVTMRQMLEVTTRLWRWIVVPRGTARAAAVAFDSPWTRVNNCTRSDSPGEPDAGGWTAFLPPSPEYSPGRC